MLAEAGQSAMSGDVELSKNLVRQRRSLQANIDLLSYLDAHTAHTGHVNNELVFDDPAEGKGGHDEASPAESRNDFQS
jgi:hypothetical protein